MIASDLGHMAIIETLLVEYKNDPNVQNKAGWSALMFASRNGHLQVVELLLKEMLILIFKLSKGGQH